MERVWKELKNIEMEAERIRSESLRKSKEIVATAREEAEKLISDSKKHAEEEADELLDKYLEKAKRERENSLKKSEVFIEKLRVTVEKRINEAVKMIFDMVLGKTEV